MSRKVSTAKAGNEIASCRQVSSDSHHSTNRGGLRAGFMALRQLLPGALLLVAVACDPITGTGSGTPPDPNKYLKVDSATRTAVVTLIAGYPASDYQFNYDGYGNGQLLLTVPVGWTITVQCANRSTVNQSCAVVTDGHSTQPLQPDWSTPDPQDGLKPGESGSFVFAPRDAGSYRIASLVPGSEASGMWLDLEVVTGGRPQVSAQG
ncbi:MAG TPA: sulfocyanin-like copper-binding protein [Candidatus Dormibacteraeota bacterium]|nr:sulfocyanin-like copper-binding protein [Candidatus Dormibacteraeota bacterium]